MVLYVQVQLIKTRLRLTLAVEELLIAVAELLIRIVMFNLLCFKVNGALLRCGLELRFFFIQLTMCI